MGSCGDGEVHLLARRARGSNPGFATSSLEIGYLLLPSCDVTERLLKGGKILKTTQPKSYFILIKCAMNFLFNECVSFSWVHGGMNWSAGQKNGVNREAVLE